MFLRSRVCAYTEYTSYTNEAKNLEANGPWANLDPSSYRPKSVETLTKHFDVSEQPRNVLATSRRIL